MLPPKHRLRRKSDFETVFSKGRKTFFSPFSIRVKANGKTESRFAIVVGGKVSKKAVERNRLRRQVQEIVRRYLPSIVLGKDVIVHVQKEAKTLSFVHLSEALLLALKKAGLLL